MNAAIAGYRRPLLVVAVAVGVGAAFVGGWRLWLVQGVGLLVLFLADTLGRRKGELRVVSGAFTTIPYCGPLARAVFLATFLGPVVSAVVGGHFRWFALAFGVVLVPLLVAGIVEVWRGYDIRVGPDGLTQWRLFGRVTVPWEALASAVRDRETDRVELTFARPEVVGRAGLVRRAGSLASGYAGSAFVAAVIGCYLAYPEARSGIGTEDGYRRLLLTIRQPAEESSV